MKTLQKSIWASVVVSAFSNAYAEELTTPSVKVTASRVEQELKDVNMSISVINAEEIKRSGARNVGELLQNIPGVRVNNDGGQGIKRISIRGNSTFQTLVLIDGQKISEQKSMSGAPFLISNDQIERIEVIKGPSSVLYGSEALGGVINIITKKGGNQILNADFSLGYNTAAEGKSGSAALYGAQNGWHYRLGFAADKNQALKTPAGKMENTYFQSRAVNAYLAYDVNPNAQVGGRFDFYNLKFGSGSYGMPGFAVDVPHWKRIKGAIFAELKNINENLLRVKADFFYQKNEKEMINTVPASQNAAHTIIIYPLADNLTNQYGLSLQSDWQLGERHFLIAGYEYDRDNLKADSSTKTYMHFTNRRLARMNGTSISSWRNYDGYQAKHAVFAAMETQLPHDLTLNYGLRYTHVQSKMQVHNRLEVSEHNNRTSSDGSAVFNAGLTWQGVDDLTLRAAFSQGYLFPLLQFLYVDTAMGQSSGTTLSNPNLKPETSNNFEIGARYLQNGWTADGTLFYAQTKDLITTRQISRIESQYHNVARAKTLGAELSLAYEIAQSGITPYLNATWIDRRYIVNGSSSRLTGSPKAYGQYGVRVDYPYHGIDFRLDIYGYSQSASKGSLYTYGGATTWNLTAGMSFGRQKEFDLDLALYNLGDKLYQNDGAIYEAGRSAALKFNARF